MDLVTLVLRTVFVYFFILILMRLMGKREIGKLSIFDLVVSIMIAELGVLTLENIQTPLLMGLIPIVILFFTQLGLSYLTLRSEKIRLLVDGKPSVLIEHGRIREDEMKKQRYNLDDLLMQLRENDVHSLSQVEFAILEPSGKLTVFEKEKERAVTKEDLGLSVQQFDMPLILIKDGDVQETNLHKLGRNRFWLKKELKKRIGRSGFKDISFCSIDPNGEWYIDVVDRSKNK